MGLEQRPHIGTWKLNGQRLVQVTPDALVYLNGDLSLPGCQKCSGKIDIQKFLTEVSVDAGTEAGSHSATFSLAIPLHHNESFARDAKFILRPGLEVHIYMRGYFPVKGMYSNLAEKKSANTLEGSAEAPPPPLEPVTPEPQHPVPSEVTAGFRKLGLDANQTANAELIYSKFLAAGYTPSYALAAINQSYGETRLKNIQQHGGPGLGLFQLDPNGLGAPSEYFQAGKAAGTEDTDTTYNALDPGTNIDRVISVIDHVPSTKRAAHDKKATPQQSLTSFFGSPTGLGVRNQKELPWKNSSTRYTREEWEAKWDNGHKARSERGRAVFGDTWDDPKFNARALAFDHKTNQTVAPVTVPSGAVTTGDQQPEALPAQGEFDASFLEEMGLAGMGIENTLAYPYYHVFHGVVTQVNHSYSGGVSTVSVSCNSMLHFWQYHNMSTNASVFGARPLNSKNKMSLVGNNFTGMHPYAIIYSLHYDMAGAAGGVGFALSAKSNQQAVSEGGESLFSLNVRYWEKRFSRGTKLRMHGATGELFSTMAAAWLSRKSSASLMSALRNRFETKKNHNTTKIDSEMLALGLVAGPNVRAAIDATRFAAQSKPNKGNAAKFEINVLDMQAFVSNIGDWGQVNLFESSYESKLDVANKVCGITGFEFYQDVDGDFVFKPPMWNLDTSSSRVYRLEDIDIININFSEKEPQVTYMTVKGGHFKGVIISGLENEWGVRGQYLDYRLIAQFGWRPGSYETNYFNDPKSMFFAAVNRMDAMNIGVNAASVTIPIRPELRPGYPVYIPYLDCYYYCNSFAHSHSVGGQCTTSLQLVGKRAKFFAPGKVNQSGLDGITLGDTRLPEKPLEVLGLDGKPRLSGFPNVVMALDPSKINPLFWVVGMDIENITDTRVVKYMIEIGLEERTVFKDDEAEAVDGRASYYIMRDMGAGQAGEDGEGVKVKFFFEEGNLDPGQDTTGGINIMLGAKEYFLLSKAHLKFQEDIAEGQRDKQWDITAKQSAIIGIRNDPEFNYDTKHGLELQAKMKKLQDEITTLVLALEKDIEQKQAAKAELEAKWRSPTGDNPGVALLLGVFEQTRVSYLAGAGRQEENDLSSTINLLDMLADKKATFSNGQQPGQYRYYSASHPDLDQQGPKTTKYNGRKLETSAPASLEGRNPPAPLVVQYSKQAIQAPFPGAKKPEAELLPNKTPLAGIRVLTGNNVKGGEVLATSEITELMFTVQDVTLLKNVTSSVHLGTATAIGKAADKKIAAQFTLDAVGQFLNSADSVQTLFRNRWDKMGQYAQAAITSMESVAATFNPPVPLTGLGVPSFPDTLVIGKSFSTRRPFNSFKYNGNSGVSLGPTTDKAPLTTLAARAGLGLAKAYSTAATALSRRAVNKVPKGHPQYKAAREAIAAAFVAGFNVGAPIKTSVKGSKTSTVEKGDTTFSPVFPVSDDKGYHVIGSYRYGRGVDIDPEGVFDQLHKHDLFSLLDKSLVDQINRVFVEKKSIKIPKYETVQVGNTKKVVPVADQEVSGADAAKYLNEEALRQLRAANLTDAQILDYSHALNKGTNPNQLDFSLANLFSDITLDGVQKIPLVNAGFSLADLSLQQAGHVCNCKAAEASILIEAFGQQQFVDLVPEGVPVAQGFGSGDTVARWVSVQAEQAAIQWGQQQQALRGQVLDRGGSNAVQSFLDLTGIDTPGHPRKSPFETAAEDVKAKLDALMAKSKTVTTMAENIITGRENDQ